MALLQVDKAGKPGKERIREAYSGPHSIWDSLTDPSGEAAAAREDAQVADTLARAIKREGGGDAEVAAAVATQEMADAASGVMAEASRLASDIMSAGMAFHRFSSPSHAGRLNGIAEEWGGASQGPSFDFQCSHILAVGCKPIQT